MKFRGFTLIEVAVTVVIASLLLHGIFNLLFVTMNRFTKQEEALLCISDASLISARLRQDFEACAAPSTATEPLSLALSSITVQGSTLSFLVRSGSDLVPVRYTYNNEARVLIREMAGQSSRLGEGRIAGFAAFTQILGQDGSIFSIPPDPETAATPAPASSTVPLRCWVKIALTVEGEAQTKPPVKHAFGFRIFPVRLNRTLQSIWNTL